MPGPASPNTSFTGPASLTGPASFADSASDISLRSGANLRKISSEDTEAPAEATMEPNQDDGAVDQVSTRLRSQAQFQEFQDGWEEFIKDLSRSKAFGVREKHGDSSKFVIHPALVPHLVKLYKGSKAVHEDCTAVANKLQGHVFRCLPEHLENYEPQDSSRLGLDIKFATPDDVYRYYNTLQPYPTVPASPMGNGLNQA
ncbi:hypothetical protein FB451DRAFT_1374149 [Mycena latifolia]|nr:hypothetical protein FB451DRAFT_1374149 [Mycena latifolia]